MKYFSMFSGIGGFEYGINQVDPNATCVGYSEIDKYAIQIYKKHYGGHKNYGDANKIIPEQIPDFELLVGGFPCQAFSIAGSRRGFQDTRGTLFFEIARIIKAKQPRLLLLENVKGLLNHDKGNTFTIILKTLDELGYDAQWQVLNSKHFGVPQNRERVFIVGHLRGTPFKQIFPIRRENKTASGKRIIHPTITGAIGRAGSSDEYLRSLESVDSAIKLFKKAKDQHSRIYQTDGISPTLAGASKLSGDCTPKLIDLSNARRDNGKRGPTFYDKIAPAITKRDHKEPRLIKENLRIRKLTPIECERLQGFPDNWTEDTSDTQRYKCLGNAVTTNVIQAIIEQVIK